MELAYSFQISVGTIVQFEQNTSALALYMHLSSKQLVKLGKDTQNPFCNECNRGLGSSAKVFRSNITTVLPFSPFCRNANFKHGPWI